MSDRKLRALGLRIAVSLTVLGAGSALAFTALPAAAGAATLVTPGSLSNCFGSLKADATGKGSGQSNLLDYSITCSTDISSYTVFVVRSQDADNNIQQYATNPNVIYPSTYPTPGLAGTVSSQGVSCEGVIPSDGVNCYAQAVGSDGKTPVLGAISAWDTTQGSISLDEPYCKYLPKGAKPGTSAVPGAIVEYIVTDNTGAEDGPFVLGLKGSKCPKVANAVPAKAANKSSKKKSRRAAIRHSRTRRG
ncbi:MAG TPA: hypothetical protein VGI55_06770 [Solirubrobacteraceae bacterium]